MTGVLVEVCADSLGSVRAAGAGGADRVELCASLVEGGVTPSAGLLEAAKASIDRPVFVLCRPRGGDFLYDDAELRMLARDVAFAREHGADGIVSGALTADGRVDVPATRRLVDAARPLPFTFHRAFDHARDPLEALEDLLGLGVERVLTSGGRTRALDGADVLAALVARADDALVVLAGGGVRRDNVGELVRRTGAREVHLSAAAPRISAMRHANPECPLRADPPMEGARLEADPAEVRAVRAALDGSTA